MQDAEASAIARKIRNLIVVQNQNPRYAVPIADLEITEVAQQPGFFANVLMVSALGLAVFFTNITLFLVDFVRELQDRLFHRS